LYGDHPRSPGRDDRHEGADPRQAPWEAGHGPAPAYDDVKVAGSPDHAPPGRGGRSGDAGAYETTALPDSGTAGAYDPAETRPEGIPAVSYDMSAPYGEEPAYEHGDPATAAYEASEYDAGEYEAGEYEAGATSAMPFPGSDAAPTATDFEAVRRTPHASRKKMIRFAAVAAAVAVVGGGGVAWAVTGGSSGKTQASKAQAQPAAPAPLTDAQRKDAEDKRRKELKKRASRAARDEVVRPRLLARGTPPPTKKPDAAGTAGDPTPVGEAQKIARAMLPDFGWSPSSQFGCLVNLWNKESHWNTHASNPSGAYGIPQALPGSKMASAGPDWQNNAHTQIKWGLGYIKSRYSSPCDAWQHSESIGWY
jgi:hypothetical protein